MGQQFKPESFDKTTAKKFDTNKPRLDLVPPSIMFAMGRGFGYGAGKYGDRNWQQGGLSQGRLFGALMRHLWAYWRGENNDDESDLSHLDHAACCLAMLIETKETGIGPDDRAI